MTEKIAKISISKKTRFLIILLGISTTVFLLSITFLTGFLNITSVKNISMEPSLCNKTKVLLSKAIGSYGQNDFILYKYAENIELAGRVIAKPGDKVKFNDGKVYLNEQLIEENYLENSSLKLKQNDGLQNKVEYTMQAGNYFVLADNRENSIDSRKFVILDEKEIEIKGKIIFNLDKNFGFSDGKRKFTANNCG